MLPSVQIANTGRGRACARAVFVVPDDAVADLRLAAGQVEDAAAGRCNVHGCRRDAGQTHRAARGVAGEGHVGQLGTAGQVVDGAAAHRGPVAGHLHVGERGTAALIVQRAAVVAGRIAAERGIADGRVAATHQRHGPALLGDVAHQGQVGERRTARFGKEAAALVLFGRRAAIGLAAGDGETVQSSGGVVTGAEHHVIAVVAHDIGRRLHQVVGVRCCRPGRCRR